MLNNLFKGVVSLVASLLLTATCLGEAGPAAILPENITLKSGAILRRVSVVRWEKDRVVLKHAGGVDPVPFSIISPADLERVLAVKADKEKPRKITGTVYVTTRGAGAYKFANADVIAYPQEALGDAQRPEILHTWPALAGARTDANGQFSITVPNSKPAFLFCITRRSIGDRTETNIWAVKINNDVVDLSEQNSL
jgi:hypothetical protein